MTHPQKRKLHFASGSVWFGHSSIVEPPGWRDFTIGFTHLTVWCPSDFLIFFAKSIHNAWSASRRCLWVTPRISDPCQFWLDLFTPVKPYLSLASSPRARCTCNPVSELVYSFLKPNTIYNVYSVQPPYAPCFQHGQVVPNKKWSLGIRVVLYFHPFSDLMRSLKFHRSWTLQLLHGLKLSSELRLAMRWTMMNQQYSKLTYLWNND